MGKLQLFAFVVGAAACGSNNNAMIDAHIVIADVAPPDQQKVFMDAPPPMYDFSCLGNTAPAGPGGTITAGGTFDDVSYNGSIQMNPINGGTINFCKSGTNCQNTNLLDTKTSDNTGAFTSAALNATNPVDLFIAATATGERPVNIYPASPLVGNITGLPVYTFTPQNLMFLEGFVGVTQDAGKGILVLGVIDCTTPVPQRVSGATLSVKQGGVDVAGTTVVDGSMFGQGGGAIIFNVPVGATDVNATYMAMTFRSHTVAIVAGTTVGTLVKPGY